MKTTKNRVYSDLQLQSAISSVKEGMRISEASRIFCIPKATLHDKVNKKYQEGATSGAHSVLTKDEERQLVTWILYLSDVGFPITKQNLLNSVKKLVISLQRPNPFKNNTPGRHWYEGFMTRHPELSNRVSQSLTAPRANITEESIRAWFGRVKAYLKKENLEEILTDPRRIFNCDESAFYLCPKENSVIVKKGSNRVYSRTANDEKECLTVLVTVSADGNMQPPLVIFPYKRTPASIILNMPPKWAIGRSDSGWMTGETFYEHITNVFYPWLIENNIPFPVILFMDGHSSHINLPLSEFCREKQIILTALLPNSTHRLQPLDVAVFRPLKHHWKEQRQADDQNKKLKKEDFAKALDQCIKNAALNGAIINGFRTCGLYPFDPNSIDFSKLITQIEKTDEAVARKIPETTSAIASLLAEVEMRIPEDQLEEFQMCGDVWLGDPKNHGLFYFWKKINDECLEAISDHEETLNANMNNLNRTNIHSGVDWLNNPPVLDLEIQPDGSLSLLPDMQLPCLSENTSNVIAVSESLIALEKDLESLPDKSFIDNNKPTDIETRQSHQKIPLKSTQPDDRSVLTEITNLQGTLNLDTQQYFATENTSKIKKQSIPSTPREKNHTVPDFKDHNKPNDLINLEKHHQTPLKETQIENLPVLTPLKTITFEDMAALRNKTHTTPAKLQELDNKYDAPSSTTTVTANKNIPTPLKHIQTPFKNALFWPETTKKDSKRKLTKKLTPTVAISEEFIAHQRRLDTDKKEKERIKEEKKNKRTNLSKDNVNKKKKLTKSSNTTVPDTEQLSSLANNKSVGDYVVIKYEGEFFPGVIIDIKGNDTSVKTMAMSGLNWKWPNKEDIMSYQEEDIVCKIKCPTPINKRGVFSVPEIDTLRLG